ncbi:PKD domain-containing protein [Fulvivirga ligni]|uniref:PKD domain-containing protein n=1 Tax=Fulvivirga ligni TaxID=2904246 RepID=UPI001F3CE671|nr:PKD domain-containing protein [Fulvivirga ligni]UII19713.1 PKD domain-containing protein [Fulvivirga ligni]
MFRSVTLLVLFFYISTYYNTSYAQLTNRPKGTTDCYFGYVEYLPPTYHDDPNKLFPVILFWHGFGEKGNGTTELGRIYNNGPIRLINQGKWPVANPDGELPAEEFIVIAPQNSGGFANPDHNEHTINYIIDNYKADPDRIYMTGLSAGGISTWNYLGKYYSTIAAAIPIAGNGNTVRSQACNFKNIPIWAFHGDADGTVTVNGSINPVNSVNACVPPPDIPAKVTIYPGVGHNSWSMTYNLGGMNNLYSPSYDPYDISIYDWLLQQTRGISSPIANAGPDITLNLPLNSTNINGSGTSPGGSITSYQWTKVSGPTQFTLSNATIPVATVSNMVEGIYTFRLTVTDNNGQTDSDDMQIIVNNINQSPTVNAGSDIILTLPVNSATLTGIASDVDGNISSYLWEKKTGPAATLSGVNTAILEASNLVEGTYNFRLTVTDDDGASSFDEVRITVNAAAANIPPVANAGTDQIINLPVSTAILTGIGTDANGSIASYSWEQYSGPSESVISNASSPTANVSGLVEGIYTFRLTVTDDEGESDYDDVQVTVISVNANPTANAGINVTITLPTSTATLSGSGSDSDGSIVSYSWHRITGPTTFNITNDDTPTPTLTNLVEGTYNFRLTVTDDDNATGIDDVLIIVLPAPVNNPPVANAGPDKWITLPTNSTSFSGSATDSDGSITTYQWQKTAGPASFTLSGENTSTLTVSNLTEGTYTFRLTVTDNDGDQGTDLVSVTVNPTIVNQAPEVSAGPDRNISLPQTSLALNGTATDADGSITIIAWTQSSGPTSSTINNGNTLTPTVSGLVAGTYQLQIEATDNDGASSSDIMRINVSPENLAPNVFAGNDVELTLPTNSTSITGVATDDDGSIIFTNWTQTSGPAATMDITGNLLSLSNLTEGFYTFEFSASDDDGAESSDRVNVRVNSVNALPVVDVGPNRQVQLPTNTINITGSAHDPEDGALTYNWTKHSGPTVTMENINTATLTLKDLVQGIYLIRLTVTDPNGGSAYDELTVTVLPEEENHAPVANAGPDKNITLPQNFVNLTGSGSDSDGSIVSYRWTKKSGPALTISNPNTPTLALTGLLEGTYIFTLEVTDDDGDKGTDDVRVIVNPEIVNEAPTANAGADKNVLLPKNSITLIGSGFDPDGSISSYQWSQVSGPNNVSFTGANLASVNISGLIEGVYVIKLTVTDNEGATDEDRVRITVLPADTNVDPIANAGPDINIYLPTNNINLAGSGSDVDGTIASYQWSQISGDAGITLNNTTTPILSASGLVEGIFIFSLTVTDNDGASHSDEVRVQVFSEETNQVPQVNAGTDKTIILPNNSLQVQALASDADGSIATYLWAQRSGQAATLSSTSTAKSTIGDLVEGVYLFRVTVTDDDGARNFDEIKITVLPAGANEKPNVNAGSDLSIKLPTNTVTINGIVSDPDGEIASIEWDKIQGPPLTFSDATNDTTTLTGLSEGLYKLKLIATDDDGATNEDEMSITVLPASANLNPVADAGADIIIDINDGPVNILGSGSDQDGSITTYAWEKLSGSNIDLSGTDSPTLTISGYSEGTYQIRLSVTDNDNAIDTDVVQVIVTNEPNPVGPIAHAGDDATLILPDSTYTLEGSAETESLIDYYTWRLISGPELNGLPSTERITPLKFGFKGTYILQLEVGDVNGLQATDEITIVVKDGLDGNDFPKLFTPNGDGNNDTWIIENLENVEGCELVIYDKYGKKVYEVNGYDNTWDATLNGTQLEEGPYYYVFKCEDGQKISGGLRVIR